MADKIKELAVTVRIRNNRLLERRQQLGLTQKKLAAAAEVPIHAYGPLECMRLSPIDKSGGWNKYARRLAGFYDVSEEELFPGCVIGVDAPVKTVCMDASDIELLGSQGEGMIYGALPPTPEEAVSLMEEVQSVKGAVASLTDREHACIDARFGLSERDDWGMTLDEVAGVVVGEDGGTITRERVRQIEAKALRKLRHPSRSRKLAAYYVDDSAKRLSFDIATAEPEDVARRTIMNPPHVLNEPVLRWRDAHVCGNT
jgi:transcriptional regulator with XRE-family HTH domain